ncbi:hypothetical protein HETIRDRAFT_459808 [Heterobasidion irregulare TC 32-1]|uniref:Phospholipase D/nuclease n=1 Tax=Heterobasidion irregulare (strain TC 32-1) TaxID=747525 RepID=W4K423_HETIT|nr:uncharacterized protein HETIRDRAFT_459808 [Heterobasidion irregulare TC 32-1]ETW80095.1 hypothetical protein HETIRDRAFT_459808 [Heterobasidion irregulare TC 32-1]
MSEEDNIAMAIALSLQESQAGRNNVRSEARSNNDQRQALESDQEAQFQEELRRAMEVSANEFHPSTSRVPPLHNQTSARGRNETQPEAGSSSTASLFLSERAELERARLERQKRLRPVDDDGDDDSGGGAGSSGYARAPSRKRPHKTTSFQSSSREESLHSSSVASTSTAPATSTARGKATSDEALFWDGEIRQTANKHVERGKNGEDGKPVWRLSEIIGDKSEIAQAIISTYAYDIEWISNFFDRTTPVVLVTQPANGSEPTIKQILHNWIRVTPVLRGGRGVMHMKFFLLFYKSGRLRLVISTANLVDFDWRDIENTVWVQDIPIRQTPIAHDPKASDFPTSFERVLKALNVGPALTSFVHNDHPTMPFPSLHPGALRTVYDFTRVHAKLVPSVAGKHEGWPNVIRTGHTALMKALREIGAEAGKSRRVMVEYQGSSIGTYSTQWVNEFYGSASGESPEKWLDEPKSRRAKLPWPLVKILFPTRAWVQGSVLGEKGGGTMFCRKNQWEGAKFPRELFVESRSKRGKVLMHSKMIIATFEDTSTSANSSRSTTVDTESDDDIEIIDGDGKEKRRVIGWTYVGSHNFTPSAWGTLSGSGFTPILNITNYELGIVLPLYSQEEIESVSCFERPPKKYGSNDRPWMQETSAELQAH